MSFRFLIDECLSPELVRMAVAAGHVGSTCVRDRGWAGVKDWKLVEHVVAGDYTLVTHNCLTFGAGARTHWAASMRRPVSDPGVRMNETEGDRRPIL